MDHQLTIGILIAYLGILLGVGIYASRKISSTSGFFLANRSLGSFALIATITATAVGGSATIATGAVIYQFGLPGIWIDIGGALGLVVLGFILAKLVRQTGLFTLPEITGHLFNNKVRSAAAILIILTQIAWIALLIQATSAVLIVLFPIDYQYLLLGITLIFILYTLVGGQFAVVYTDIIQFLVMIIGICCIAMPLLYMQASDLFSSLSSDYLSFPVNTSLTILPVLSFFFMMLLPHIVGPDIYSKILSAKNTKTAAIGAIGAGVCKLAFAIAIGIIAIAAVVLFPNLENPALAIPTAVLSLSPLLAGIILAAFVSVMLSSADSVLLSAGTVLSVDITKKQTIFISRIGILTIGLAAFGLALYQQNIIDTLKLAYTIFTAGLTLPIICGFFKEKTGVTSTGAFWSLITGGGSSLIWLLLDSPYIDAVLIGLLVSIIPLLLFRKKK